MPYLMRTRNESAVYYRQRLDLSRTLPFIERWNATHADELTMFELVLLAFQESGQVRLHDVVDVCWTFDERIISRLSIAFRVLAWGMLLAVVSAGCSRASKEGLTLAGSTSVQPFAEQWADAYQVGNPAVSIHVQGGGSTAGVQAAISGAAQIGMSSRPLTSDEARRVTAIPVARDGIAIVVHPTMPVSDLRLDQVRAIYAGEIVNWRRVSGRDSPITVITREEGSGTRAAFEALVMDRQRIVASALVQDSTGAVRQMVASDPAAIGYVSIGLVDASIKALKLHGVVPSEANINAGTYPLVRPFLFVVSAAQQPVANDFIGWITGPEGRALTRREGLLPPGE